MIKWEEKNNKEDIDMWTTNSLVVSQTKAIKFNEGTKNM